MPTPNRPTDITILQAWTIEEHLYLYVSLSGTNRTFVLHPGAIDDRKQVYGLSTDQEAILACISEHLDRWKECNYDWTIESSVAPDIGAGTRVKTLEKPHALMPSTPAIVIPEEGTHDRPAQ